MKRETFKKRLEILKRYGCNVISLDAAVKMLAGEVPMIPNAVVLTADDGYKNSPDTLSKDCNEYGFPLTIYLTSYYAEKQEPIFNVALSYLFWRTKKSEINLKSLSELELGLESNTALQLNPENIQTLSKKLNELFSQDSYKPERVEFLHKLAQALDLSPDEVFSPGKLMLMDQREISACARQTTSVQLHTHRHRFPDDDQKVKDELLENRRYISQSLPEKDIVHFCYPSGVFHENQISTLRALGVKSATTLLNGINFRSDDPLKLKRIIDKETMSDAEFAANVSGAIYTLKKLSPVKL